MEFQGFPKIGRLSREMIITEKLDGTNAQIAIGEDGSFFAGSRTRWLSEHEDNFGFYKWAVAHKDELIAGLGPGRHFGEWWGRGIQRGYGLEEKRFSLFNVSRWADSHNLEVILDEKQVHAPECCYVVPILGCEVFDSSLISMSVTCLRISGSVAAPGFMNPEGVVVFHTANGALFKKTLEKDNARKSLV